MGGIVPFDPKLSARYWRTLWSRAWEHGGFKGGSSVTAAIGVGVLVAVVTHQPWPQVIQAGVIIVSVGIAYTLYGLFAESKKMYVEACNAYQAAFDAEQRENRRKLNQHRMTILVNLMKETKADFGYPGAIGVEGHQLYWATGDMSKAFDHLRDRLAHHGYDWDPEEEWTMWKGVE